MKGLFYQPLLVQMESRGLEALNTDIETEMEMYNHRHHHPEEEEDGHEFDFLHHVREVSDYTSTVPKVEYHLGEEK